MRVGPHGHPAASGSQPKSDAPKPDRFKRVPVAEAWCVVIDEDELVKAVRALNAGGRPARADTVSIELGAIADDGRHWDLMAVADDLAELESLGKLERAAAFEWEGVGPPPKALIWYEAPR